MAHSSLRAVFVTLLMPFIASAAAAPEEDDTAFARAAAKAVERIELRDGFSGVVLVARGDQVLLRKSAGFADRERNIPNTPETKFPIASINKQFTAAAILLLAEEGRLALDDPVSKYYPASPPAWRDITVKHLLTHTSGLADNYATRPEVRSEDQLFLSVSYEDLIQMAAGDPLAFKPGTRFRYANTGYMLLTTVIERASGQRYPDFLRNRILVPLGMNDTGYGDIPGSPLKGYRQSAIPLVPNGPWRRGVPANVSALAGGGAAYSTVDDILRWLRALNGSSIFSSAAVDAMFADHGHNYGLGWYFQTKFGRRLAWNMGNLTPAGFSAIVDRFPDGVSFIVLTNNTGVTGSTATVSGGDSRDVTVLAYAARDLVEEVERLYFGRAP